MTTELAKDRWERLQTEALRILRAPESEYGSIPKHYRIYLRLIVQPSFGLAVGWSVFKPAKIAVDNFFVINVTWDITKDQNLNFDPIASLPSTGKKVLKPTLTRDTGIIPIDCLNQSMDSLKQLKMMPFSLSHDLDLDSTQKCLSVCEGRVLTELAWLNSNIREYAGVDCIFEEIIDQIQSNFIRQAVL